MEPQSKINSQIRDDENPNLAKPDDGRPSGNRDVLTDEILRNRELDEKHRIATRDAEVYSENGDFASSIGYSAEDGFQDNGGYEGITADTIRRDVEERKKWSPTMVTCFKGTANLARCMSIRPPRSKRIL